MLAEAAATTQTNRSDVIACLKQASAATGSDFDYLLCTAMRESSLKPSAKAGTSSAAGLFQFVEQTWLGMVKQFGAKYGLGSYAAVIEQGANGHYRAASPADRQAILALRNDPKVASLMAGEYANQTRSILETNLGRPVGNGDLYAAHFLGPDAACRLIRLNDANPQANAAESFPAAADANRNVFFHKDGTPKTVREVYDWANRSSDGAAVDLTATHMAGAVRHHRAHVYIRSSALPDDALALDLVSATGADTLSLLAGSATRGKLSLSGGLLDVLSSLHLDGQGKDLNS